MIRIKVFVFNPFQENTYVLHDETLECVIIDPGCHNSGEEQELARYIRDENLKPVALINTHPHIDHVLGNNFVYNTYKLRPLIHAAGEVFLKAIAEHGSMFGLEVEEPVLPEKYLEEGEIFSFGNAELEILYTPGHVDGSVCLANHENRFVITGDVLFNGSIGRTDLPTGDFDLLAQSITQKLYSLPDDFVAYPGHGPATTIGDEKFGNPYVMG
jgi:glyoxylase-like metal-dependent hydrolase (beta-lactamase superfamily II)